MRTLIDLGLRGARHRGRTGMGLAFLLAVLPLAGCGTPTEPTSIRRTLTGTWRGSGGRGPCGQGWSEDWSEVVLDLTQTGDAVSGEIHAAAGRRFPISSADAVTLSVGNLEGTSTCYAYFFTITDRTFDGDGNLRRVSGHVGGRCCGTVAGTFAFERT